MTDPVVAPKTAPKPVTTKQVVHASAQHLPFVMASGNSQIVNRNLMLRTRRSR